MASSFTSWIIGLAIAVIVTVAAGASGTPELLSAAAALVGLSFGAIAIGEQSALAAAGASRATQAAATARHLARVWVWGALTLLVLYLFVLTWWREWWHFCLGFTAVGAVSLFFAISMQRDADDGREDQTLLKLARTLSIVLAVGTAVAVVGLVVDPDKKFFDMRKADWAAVNVFFFGSIGLGLISAHALTVQKPPA